jgi:hypothetical protein
MHYISWLGWKLSLSLNLLGCPSDLTGGLFRADWFYKGGLPEEGLCRVKY